MIRLLAIGALLLALNYAISQDTSNSIIETQKLINSIENSLEINEESIPYDILEHLQDLRKEPVNINRCNSEELYTLPFLSEYQINSFTNYRQQFGNLLSYAELLAVPGFDLQLVKNIMPYITLSTQISEIHRKRSRLKTVSFLRYSRSLYSDINYLKNYDYQKSITSVYLGSPDKYLFKIKQESKTGINWGLIAEKDAGEVFFTKNLPDSIRNMIITKKNYGFDFYTGFIEYDGKSVLDKVILGDYQITIGQGLNIWSSGYFSNPTNPIQSIRYGRGIKANTSSYETGYFRGGVITIKYKSLSGIAFYSNRMQDAVIKVINGINSFSSFKNSGYHRSINEINSKNSIRIIQSGGSAEIHLKKGIIGFSFINTLFSSMYHKEKEEEDLFSYTGRNISNAGCHWNFTLKNLITFYGELSLTDKGKPSIISGLYISPKPFLDLSLSYQYFNAGYFNISANPARKGNFIPESNIRFFLAIDPLRKLELSVNIDFIHFNWLRSRISKPNNYITFNSSLSYCLNENFILLFSYSHKGYEQNLHSPTEYIDPVIILKKNSAQLSVFNILSNSFSSKSRIILNNIKSTNSNGGALSQEFAYKNIRLKTNVTISFIIFDTDNYDSRIYVYEKNVLHAFSFPSYSGSGAGGFILLKTEISKWLSLWFRISKTKYFRNSSNTETWKNKKGEISIQARIKL